MMLVLKLPILYLIGIVWWAVRAEPRPYEPAVVDDPIEPIPCPWNGRGTRPRSRPPLARGRRVVAPAAR
jgi:hypothetical protein